MGTPDPERSRHRGLEVVRGRPSEAGGRGPGPGLDPGPDRSSNRPDADRDLAAMTTASTSLKDTDSTWLILIPMPKRETWRGSSASTDRSRRSGWPGWCFRHIAIREIFVAVLADVTWFYFTLCLVRSYNYLAVLFWLISLPPAVPLTCWPRWCSRRTKTLVKLLQNIWEFFFRWLFL